MLQYNRNKAEMDISYKCQGDITITGIWTERAIAYNTSKTI